MPEFRERNHSATATFVVPVNQRSGAMEAAIERVMKTYGMMVNLTVEQSNNARSALKAFLSQRSGTEHELTVQGLRYLRGVKNK